MLHYPKESNMIGATRELHVAKSILERCHGVEQASEIFNEKVRARPMTLRPSSPDPLSRDARSSRRLKRLRKKEHFLRKQKPRPLSAKERRKLGVHDILLNQTSRKWETYTPLRDLWHKYIRKLLGLDETTAQNAASNRFVTGASAGPALASADFHGAELQVVRSNCVSRVGIHGIVLKDTKYTFELVTPSNELKTIPKSHTIFRFEIPRKNEDQSMNDSSVCPEDDMGMQIPELSPFVFEIHGDQFNVRPAERANKKFKPRKMDYL